MKKLIFLLLIIFLQYLFAEETLTLKTLLNLALERNPGIKSLKEKLEAQNYRIAPEKALPEPMIGFSIKNIGIDRFSVGEEMMSGIGISFSQKIPFPGKLKLRGEIAEIRALRTEEGLKSFTLSLIGKIKELYSKLFFYNRGVEILEKKKEILGKALKVAETRYSVGEGIQSDIFKAQVEISKIEEELILMKQMLNTVEREINSLLDFPPEKPLGKPEEIPFYEMKFELNELYKNAERISPILKEAELMIEESKKEVELSKKEFYPDFMIEGGKEFKGRFKDMYEIMIGVEIPIYYKKKQENLLKESISNFNSSKNNYISMKNEVFFMINENFIMAKASENLIRLYRERIIPQATLALESSLSNYQVGKVDFLTLLSDINNLFSYEMDYYKELSNLWISVSKIEALTFLKIIGEN
jgi:outer membrane protein TolC